MKFSALIVLLFAIAATSSPYEVEQSVASVASTGGSYAAAPPTSDYSGEKNTGTTVSSNEPEKEVSTVASGYDVGGTAPSATQDIDATPTSIMDYSPTPTGASPNDKASTGSITVNVTFNGQKHPCSISKDLSQGSTPQCADQVGVTAPANINDITGMFCYAIRAQIAAVPGCEEAAKGGVLSAQLVGEASASTPTSGSGGLAASQVSSSMRSTDSSFRNAVAGALCISSAIFAFAM